MKLIIAEKPSVAFAIAKALDINGKKDGYIEKDKYVITWCVGHLVALAEPQAYDEKYSKWNYADLPIIPDNFKYKIYGDKSKQFKVIRSLMQRKDITEVVNACDAGREGELIFRLVYNMANCKKPIKRLWISSMEESAIREGFNNLKDGSEYDNLYNSALCRMWADWIVGINATRLFSLLYNKTLNIGRVQTPTLALLCDRHNKISFFQKEKYHTVSINIGNIKATSDKIPDIETAEKIDGGANGYYHLTEKRIAVRNDLSEMQTIKTVIHEIAHAKLHALPEKDNAENDIPDNRTREVQAESVAYTVCQHFGIDTSDYSFGYVAGWSSGKETAELKESLEIIRNTADGMITDIDEKLKELEMSQDIPKEQATQAKKTEKKPSIKKQLTEKKETAPKQTIRSKNKDLEVV